MHLRARDPHLSARLTGGPLDDGCYPPSNCTVGGCRKNSNNNKKKEAGIAGVRGPLQGIPASASSSFLLSSSSSLGRLQTSARAARSLFGRRLQTAKRFTLESNGVKTRPSPVDGAKGLEGWEQAAHTPAHTCPNNASSFRVESQDELIQQAPVRAIKQG